MTRGPLRFAALVVLGLAALVVLGLGAAVVAVAAPPAPAALPTPRPTLTMRAPARPAHGGFVANVHCAACHSPAGWRLSAGAGASGFDHDRTGFPLRGRHAASACSQCHTGAGAPATTCERCHRDPHEGGTTRAAPTATRRPRGPTPRRSSSTGGPGCR